MIKFGGVYLYKKNKFFLLFLISFISLYIVITKYFFEIYLVNKSSMEQTLSDGDKIFLNKCDKDFYRNEVLVFNDENTNYIKRCIGLPGDTLEIKGGNFYINNKTLPQKNTHSYFHKKKEAKSNSNLMILLCYGKEWSPDNFGPIVIPKKGSEIKMSFEIFHLYKNIIKKEYGNSLNQKVFFENMPHYYTFKQNYYFMVGDNILNSIDSRMYGPISREQIIGKATLVLYSKKNFLDKKKLFKKIE